MKKYYSYEINPVLLNILATILFIFLLAILPIAFNLSFTSNITPLFFVLIFFWLILHEILHAVGFGIFKGTKWSNITLGMLIEKGIFYCMCKQEISKANILVAIAFPFFFIGIVTLIIAIFINSFLLYFLSIINIAGAIGDIVMFFAILSMPKEVKYLDIDDQLTFTMISEKPLKEKYFSIVLKDSGKYNFEKMKSKDFTKIIISKPSKIFILIILLITIMNFIII